jgi:type VI secretion system protein ImpL
MKLSAATWIAAAVLVIWLMLGWFAGSWLGLHGNSLWILRIGLAVLGLIAFGAFLWWAKAREQSAAAQEGKAPAANTHSTLAEETDLLFRVAESKLRSSQRGRLRCIRRLPLILLVGETGSGKTSIVQNSGLDPEHLAGQIFEGERLVPTRAVNLWLARRTILVEAGGPLVADAGAWGHLVRRLAPARLRSVIGGKGQAARAVVVCVDCESLRKPEAARSLAQGLQARLREMSRILGSSFPVYVFLNVADRLQFFSDYVNNLSESETAEVLGATLARAVAAESGIYAEQQGRRVGSALDDLFYSLNERRPDFLRREHDLQKLPGVYEFPREFRKLRAPLMQFLVELCRPSQLVAGPFLRGFYFTGRRTLVVNSGPADVSPAESSETPAGATRVLDVRKLQAQAPKEETSAPVGATRVFDIRKLRAEGTLALTGLTAKTETRTIQQTLFLSHLFNDVVMADRSALGASGGSSKVRFWQKLLLASASVVLFVWALGLLVSYFGNHRLETDAEAAARGFPAADLPANQTATPDQIRNLDRLGRTLSVIGDYETNNSHPLRLGWGLYNGDRLYPAACEAYATGLRRLLLSQAQASIVTSLSGLPSQPPPNSDYDGPYNDLKAYLLTTSDSLRDAVNFQLSQVLFPAWSAGRQPNAADAAEANQQFDFFANQRVRNVKIADRLAEARQCFSSTANEDAVSRARAYLNQFPAEQRIYKAMLADAEKQGKPVNFNADFPGSSSVVINDKPVGAAFTPKAWEAMHQELKNHTSYLMGEDWVLGPQTGGAVAAPAQAIPVVEKTYEDNYANAWREFLANTKFVGYRDIPDAVKKLNLLAGNRSPLLELLCVADRNTNWGASDLANNALPHIFQPTSMLTSGDCEGRPGGEKSLDYTNGLTKLSACLEQIDSAATPDLKETTKTQCRQVAGDAKTATNGLTHSFNVDDTAKAPNPAVDTTVQSLLLKPIDYVIAGGILKPAQPKGAGDLCAALKSFNPKQATIGDLADVFGAGGSVDKFKEEVKGLSKPNPAFLSFLQRAQRAQQALYPPGSQAPQYHYTLTPVTGSGFSGFTLSIDGQTVASTGGLKQLVWSGTESGATLTVSGNSPAVFSGPMGAFRFFGQAVNWRPVGTGYEAQFDLKLGEQIVGKIAFRIDAGGNPVIFNPRFFAGLGCTSKVGEQ